MLHAKFQDHRTSCYGEEFFLMFYHIWAWRPSWSCDLDNLLFCSLFPRRLSIKFGFDLPSGFCAKDVSKWLSYTCINPAAGADNQPVVNNFIYSITQPI